MEVSVKSLGQLIDRVTPADPSSETGHWRTACVYHGSADAEWPLADQQGLSGAFTKYVIPAAEIGRVRDQLDLGGIDERRLFPDLGGLARELRRYYG